MGGEMTKMEQQVECATCPWNRNCIEPPVMTKEEVESKLEENRPKAGMDEKDAEGSLISGLMGAMFFSGKDREAIVCPVFANALRSGPEISQHIKAIMKGTDG